MNFRYVFWCEPTGATKFRLESHKFNEIEKVYHECDG